MSDPHAAAVSILMAAFPNKTIDVNQLKVRYPVNADRVELELHIAGILGHTWRDIDALQARSTCDILDFLEVESVMDLIPGYLQWLWDADEADILVSALPFLIIRLFDQAGASVVCEQLVAIRNFMSLARDEVWSALVEEDRELYQRALVALDKAIKAAR